MSTDFPLLQNTLVNQLDLTRHLLTSLYLIHEKGGSHYWNVHYKRLSQAMVEASRTPHNSLEEKELLLKGSEELLLALKIFVGVLERSQESLKSAVESS